MILNFLGLYVSNLANLSCKNKGLFVKDLHLQTNSPFLFGL